MGKKKKEKAAKGLSEKELEDMEKLKQNIMTKKSELKAEGMSGGQINKNSDIVDWVAKLNALKEKEAALKGNMTEKEAKKEATGKKGDPKEIEKLRQDIEDYKAKLKEEFGYTKQEGSGSVFFFFFFWVRVWVWVWVWVCFFFL